MSPYPAGPRGRLPGAAKKLQIVPAVRCTQCGHMAPYLAGTTLDQLEGTHACAPLGDPAEAPTELAEVTQLVREARAVGERMEQGEDIADDERASRWSTFLERR